LEAFCWVHARFGVTAIPGPVSTYYVYYSFLVFKLHLVGVFTNSYRTLVVLLGTTSVAEAARAAHMDIVHGRVT